DWNLSPNLDLFIETQMDKFLDTISNNFEQIPRAYLYTTNSGRLLSYYIDESNKKKSIGFLKRVALEECHEYSNYLLYCAIGSHIRDLEVSASLSWSFADGLVAGFLYDFGACPLDYLMHSRILR